MHLYQLNITDMKKLWIIISLLALTTLAYSQNRVLRFQQLFSDLHKKKSFNGNVLVAEKGKIIFEASYGLANEATKEKLNSQSKFMLASISKQFTAMAIVLLKKQGKLSYDDLMSKYIPELHFYKGITIRHLLTHTSGLRSYLEQMELHWDKTKFATNDDVIKTFVKHKPATLFKPNERWLYCNTGYVFLAIIVERVAQQKLSEFLQQNIFKPLKMHNTLIYHSRYAPQKVGNHSKGYIYSQKLKKKILPDQRGKKFMMVYLDGVTGRVSSTARDMLKWDRALYTNQLISAQDKALIFNSYKTHNGRQTNYGFGWNVDLHNKVYGKLVYHTGRWGGYLNYFGRHLQDDKTVILLQNNVTPQTKFPIIPVRKILYDLPLFKKVNIAEKQLKKYVGKYQFKKGSETILYKDGKLQIKTNRRNNPYLLPIATHKFLAIGLRPETIYEFFLDKQHNVYKYRRTQAEAGTIREAIKIRK
ncbi:hypothetical protein BKI52_16410 [marine bacterium AO1-C]|nr:hypothetical protein BKI52_16410 [marine bacterium AO1-C]